MLPFPLLISYVTSNKTKQHSLNRPANTRVKMNTYPHLSKRLTRRTTNNEEEVKSGREQCQAQRNPIQPFNQPLEHPHENTFKFLNWTILVQYPSHKKPIFQTFDCNNRI